MLIGAPHMDTVLARSCRYGAAMVLLHAHHPSAPWCLGPHNSAPRVAGAAAVCRWRERTVSRPAVWLGVGGVVAPEGAGIELAIGEPDFPQRVDRFVPGENGDDSQQVRGLARSWPLPPTQDASRGGRHYRSGLSVFHAARQLAGLTPRR